MLDLFPGPRALIAMVHVGALPGTPASEHSMEELLERAVAEAALLEEIGFDALIVENMHDRPYLKGEVGPEIVAAMACLCQAIRRRVSLPLGVQILAGANRAALAVAHASGCDFIRAEGYVFGHLADEGYIEASAGELLRYRKALGADSVRIVCDLKKKHSSHALTADLSLAETAEAAAFFLADGVVLTGSSTGKAAAPGELRAVTAALDLPVWIGSGITPENMEEYNRAHGLIVGSYLKRRGDWRAPIDPERAARTVERFRALR